MAYERTEVETYVRTLIAQDILKSPLSSLYQKVDRKHKKLAKEISDLIKEGEEGERVFANVETRVELEKARTMRKAVDEFKEQYPKYGKILEGLIEETRNEKNKVLVYGLKPDFKLGDEDYYRVMMSLGLSRMAAGAMVPHIIEVSGKLKKASEYAKREILVE